MTQSKAYPTRGPFRADQLRSGDPYELSDGHAIQCLPTRARGGRANLLGGAVLAADPAVQDAGIDVGFSPEPGTLRAPDVSVGSIPDEPGWAPGVPALALEYADRGQDEDQLTKKIGDLLRHGTKLVWVARLTGVPHVEVHERDKPSRVVASDGILEAPGILARPVPVRALLERDAGLEATLDNLLARRGYAGLGAVREEGREEGRLAALLELLAARFGAVGEPLVAALRKGNAAQLRAWQLRALEITSLDELLEPTP